MKTFWLPLSLRLARASLRPALLTLPLLTGASLVRAQNAPRIIFPQQGQDVRGEIAARFEGIPAGGYAIIKVGRDAGSLVFKTATAQSNYPLDTIADSSTFSGDGTYTLEVTALNAGGRVVGTSSVTFNVANSKVADASESVLLVHWTPADRLNDGVQRYRVLAESNADVQEPTASAGGEGGGSSGGGRGSSGGGGRGGSSGGAAGGDASTTYIPAPLDWQVSVLLRREVRDTNGFMGAANIATVVQEAWQHQRLSESTGAGNETGGSSSGGGRGRSSGGSRGSGGASSAGGRKSSAASTAPPVKAGWSPDWQQGPEASKYYVKAIQQTGDEINATRKGSSIAIADLLPTFVSVPVKPGSSWHSNQTILSDLSTRKPINIEGTITFTSYEDIQTPAGVSRRCAKIESRFPLPPEVSKRIAADLGNKVGTAGAGGGSGGGSSAGARGGSSGEASGADGGAADALTAADIDVAQFNMARVIWFDMDKHQIVRSEDTLRAYFEIPPSDTGAGATGGSSGGSSRGGGEGDAAAAPAEPTKVTYSMNVTTWLDDRIPPPTLRHNGGAGTAHGRDNVTEPGLTRVTGR